MAGQYTLDEIVAANALDRAPDAAYVLDESNRLVYCNPAWDVFARANHGESALSRNVLGTNVLSVCPESVRFFYEQFFRFCRTAGHSGIHGYHCSTPTRLRVYKMEVKCTGEFLHIRNTLLEDKPHPGPVFAFGAEYIREEVATMCSNCRRVRNWILGRWDWVPELIEAADRHLLSHGLCHPCSQFYYGNEFLRQSLRLQSE